MTPTPAQAYGHPDFVTDVPVQGPTDEGMRAADCWFAKNRLPTTHPECVDCGKQNPMQQNQGLLGERLSFGGAGALGFALRGPSDPEIWSKLSPDQQMWVSNSLNTLNNKILTTTGSAPCPTWGPAINLAGGCFQGWYNANYGASGASKSLRTDGVFDEDTLCALQMVAGLHPADFPAKFPDPTGQYCKAPTPVTSVVPAAAAKKLSTGAMIGIGTAGAAVLGGIVYAATRGHKKGRKTRR